MVARPSTAPVIWCDFGGVLTAPAVETLSAFCARVDVAPQPLIAAMKHVARRYGTDDIMEPLDTPLVDTQDWSHEVEQALAEEYQIDADLSNFAEHWFNGRPANNELIEYLWKYKESGLFIGMLSNMVPAFEPYWSQLVSPDLFDDLVFSYQVAARKPDRKIYDLSAARASASPVSCILIDDLPENCAGARQAGWKAIEFRTNDDVFERLSDFIDT